jgi:alcohol dehydrogenase
MVVSEHFQFSCPVKLHSGIGALAHIPFELKCLGAEKPLVLTTRDKTRWGRVRKLVSAMADERITVGVFDGIETDPQVKTVRHIARIYRSAGHDALVVLGGGPVVDTAKAVNLLVSGNSLVLESFAGENPDRVPMKPMVLVPTGWFSGTEATRYATIEKMSFDSPDLMPDLVVLDPRMFRPKAPALMADAVFTALTQAVESFVAANRNPMTDAWARASIGFIAKYLKAVLHKPGSEGQMALANACVMAACAWSDQTPGVVYRLGRSLAKGYNLPAGIAMAMLLAHWLEQTMPIAQNHVSDLLLPLTDFDIFSGTDASLRGPLAVNRIHELVQSLYDDGPGFPKDLKAAGVPRNELEDLVDRALGADCPDRPAAETLLSRAWFLEDI